MTLGQRSLAICFALVAFALAASSCGSDPPAPPVSPHSVAGPDQIVAPHTTVQLDGSGSSDPLNRSIAYHWSIASAPAGSTATIADPLSAKTTITPELEGDYNILLVVSAGNEQEGSTMHVFVVSNADAGTGADAP